jgi:hypothetical protein
VKFLRFREQGPDWGQQLLLLLEGQDRALLLLREQAHLLRRFDPGLYNAQSVLY